MGTRRLGGSSRKADHFSVATRVFSLRGRTRPVVVTMGMPEPDPKSRHGDWRCHFRISGLGSSLLRYGYGVDAFQALIGALAGIRSTLEPYRADLSWIGGELDLAFPRFVPGGWPGRLAERIEKFIDDQLLVVKNSLERRAKMRAAQPSAAAGRRRRRH